VAPAESSRPSTKRPTRGARSQIVHVRQAKTEPAQTLATSRLTGPLYLNSGFSLVRGPGSGRAHVGSTEGLAKTGAKVADHGRSEGSQTTVACQDEERAWERGSPSVLAPVEPILGLEREQIVVDPDREGSNAHCGFERDEGRTSVAHDSRSSGRMLMCEVADQTNRIAKWPLFSLVVRVDPIRPQPYRISIWSVEAPRYERYGWFTLSTARSTRCASRILHKRSLL
jgi:hypothetical protein